MARSYYLVAFEKNSQLSSLMSEDTLEKMDNFTMQFENNADLNNFFNQLYGKVIRFEDFKIFYKDENEKKIIKPLPLRYKYDRYKVDDIILGYSEYLVSDRENIKNSSIRFINTEAIKRFNDGEDLSFSEIKLLVKTFLTSYRKIREAYFEMKTKPNLSQIKLENNINSHNSNYQSSDKNLQILLDNGQIDEIMKSYSLDELRTLLEKTNNKPLVDGLSKGYRR